MSLVSLQLKQFRNFSELQFHANPAFNLISGENGSGKTSLLEAIYYLAHGRSFRTSRHQRLVQHDHEHFVLHAKVDHAEQTYSLGLQRDRQADCCCG
ncbi:AAA family ATPase [Alishewanella longhuensis]